MKSWSASLWLGLGMLLVGCASDDPGEGGFFGGLLGLGQGSYHERIRNEREALKVEEARYRDESDRKAALHHSLASRQAQAADLEIQLATLRGKTSALEQEITSLQQKRDLTTDQVADAEADVANLLDDIDRIEAERQAQQQALALGADADENADPAAFGEPPREQTSELRAYINRLREAVDALKLARERRF
jgi:chromosome segregation ATPase